MRHRNAAKPPGGDPDGFADGGVFGGRPSDKPRRNGAQAFPEPFAFTKPRKGKGKDMGDKARARVIIPYLEHAGRPIPFCAMRVLERLIDACNYDNGACFLGENHLIADCRIVASSVKKARAVLRAAGLLQWTSVEDSPYREVIWTDQRVNCYQINWPALNAAFNALKAQRDAVKKRSRKERDGVASADPSPKDGVANADPDGVANADTNLKRGTSKQGNLESGFAAAAWNDDELEDEFPL